MKRKCKWKRSDVLIEGLHDLEISLESCGGIWWRTGASVDRFFNSAWVKSQQLNYLLNQIKAKKFFFPIPIEGENK